MKKQKTKQKLLVYCIKHDTMALFDLPFMVPANSEETAEVEKELQMSDIEGSGHGESAS